MQEVERFAKLMKAVGDPLRLQVLQLLQRESYGVLELTGLLGCKQSALSHHLKILADVGFVTTRREGNSIFYRRALPSGDNADLMSNIFLDLDTVPLSPTLERAMSLANDARNKASLNFFSENSEQFKSQQDLISPIDDYRELLNELLDRMLSATGVEENDQQRKQALEIGPGEGSYLDDLSSRFEHVVALDNSEAMLDRCRHHAVKRNLDNVGFILGSTADLRDLTQQLTRGSLISARRPNCAVANMVLHHNLNPLDIFKDLSGLLVEGGMFIVSELCQHEQEWVSEAAGDIWLGFSEKQLHKWAEEAGFEQKLSSYTSLKNGFSIQIHGYRKLH